MARRPKHCNGAACDATTLRIFDESRYTFAPQYAPQRPSAPLYGEAMWLVGAASDSLSALLGERDPCCGRDDQDVGGCGKCVLVRNPSASRNLTAVVMKKSRCPPWTTGCEAGKVHLDVAVPGFDYLPESTANVCGDSARVATHITAAESAACATEVDRAAVVGGQCCSALSGATAARTALREGCELFTSWGWRRGDPALEYQVVPCPPAFVDRIAAAFDADGVVPLPEVQQAAPVAPPPPPPPPPLPPMSPTGERMLSVGSVAAAATIGGLVALVLWFVWGRPTCWACVRAGSPSTRIVTSRVRGLLRPREREASTHTRLDGTTGRAAVRGQRDRAAPHGGRGADVQVVEMSRC